jgi:hypothetical protein
MPTNSPDLSRIVANELSPDERVVWSGRPDPLAAVMAEAGSLVFGIACFLVSARNVATYAEAGSTASALGWAVFGAVGLHMLIVRPALIYRSQQNTLFAITSRRLLAVSTAQAPISVALCTITRVERARRGAGLTLRVPKGAASKGPEDLHVIMHGLSDGERAYQLLTQSARAT